MAAEELTAVLTGLTQRDRQVIELRLQGYEYPEIAERLNCSERTVRRAIQKARQLMLTRGGEKFVPSAARRPRQTGSDSAAPVRVGLPPEFAAPLKLANFLLQQQIGAGATGRVYRALDRRSNQRVGIKFLRKSLVGDEGAMSRFLREAETVADLRHPAIVPMHGAGMTSGGAIFLVMDYIDGVDLGSLRLRQSVDVTSSLRWVRQAAEAIEHAHSRDTIHCDLKPSNLLLGHDGLVRVTDFGLAVRLMDGQPPGDRLAGTPAFMAPEQVDSNWGAVSPATDVWGLGGVLYFLLFQQPPHVGPNVRTTLTLVSSETPVVLPPDCSSVPPAVLELLRKCLFKSPSDRFATAEHLLSAISEIGRIE